MISCMKVQSSNNYIFICVLILDKSVYETWLVLRRFLEPSNCFLATENQILLKQDLDPK